MNGFNLGDKTSVGFVGHNKATHYARWLLLGMGARLVELPADHEAVDMPVIIAGVVVAPPAAGPGNDKPRSPLRVRLWDFYVGKAGTGVQASAVSGVSWVIGLPTRSPLYLPSSIPEKWCGTLGVSAALSWYVERVTLPGIAAPQRDFDVSSAEIVRGFADQNFGNHKQIPTSWRRNGRISPEHGGIYPQGFFKCRDGYVSVIGRSRGDWALILAALGDPAWATEDLRNPFQLARNSQAVDKPFEDELQKYTRDDLLNLALKFGATFAPVYSKDEIPHEHLVRDTFFQQGGLPGLPFEIMTEAP